MTATVPADTAPADAPIRVRGFMPALEGMRGMSALGVLLTHVAFQTGAATTPVLGRVWGRFDMAVALFFALSGFLLWRPHAAAARGMGRAPSVGHYFRHRAARILPAYWVVVVAVLVLLPSAAGTAGFRVWVSNLALLQVFVPLTLTDGLTQMWSLSVEVAFYLVLPLFAFAALRLRGAAARRRVPALLALAVISLSWNFIPVPTPDAIHADNWLPGYLPWFAVGMVLGELVEDGHRLSARTRRIFGSQPLMWTIALAAFLLAATDFGGPAGLTRAEPWQYAAKVALGAIIGFTLLAPLVLGAGRHRWLRSRAAATLGRWSYGIFLWHLAVLWVVFPVFGILPFGGHFVLVLLLTIAITLPVAAASYALVEDPARRFARDWDRARAERSAEAVGDRKVGFEAAGGADARGDGEILARESVGGGGVGFESAAGRADVRGLGGGETVIRESAGGGEAGFGPAAGRASARELGGGETEATESAGDGERGFGPAAGRASTRELGGGEILAGESAGDGVGLEAARGGNARGLGDGEAVVDESAAVADELAAP